MESKPVIPKNEIETRIQNLQNQLLENEVDAMIIPFGIYFQYFFGKSAQPSERLIAGIIPKEDEPFVISPTFEIENIRRSTYLDQIIGWDEIESPYEILGNELKSRDLTNIKCDPKFWITEVEKIENHLDSDIEAGGEILEEIRSVKSEWELKQLRAAAEASAKGILDAHEYLEKGMTEKELLKVLSKTLSEYSGNPLSFGIVQFGANSAIPHGRPTNKKLQQDEVVLIDAGTSINGYHGDITITIPYGNPDDFEEIYEIVYTANRKAFEKDQEGVIPSELDSIARDYITENKYGDYFTHRLGHGLGLEVHEHPYIVGTNKIPLVSGNCHTIEPGIYIPNKYGIRIEDDVVVTKNGSELLYDTPRHNF